MPREKVSEYNANWGICGFTSALSHVYNSDSRLRRKFRHDTESDIRFGLLIEVLIFLKYVKAFRTDLIKGLDKLNKDLRPVSKDPRKYAMDKGVVSFIQVAENFVRAQVPISQDKAHANHFQCALTPEALLLYVQKICGYPGARLSDGDPGGRGILGLFGRKGELLHWVYRSETGVVYNWGECIQPEEWLLHECGLGHPDFAKVGCHVSFG